MSCSKKSSVLSFNLKVIFGLPFKFWTLSCLRLFLLWSASDYGTEMVKYGLSDASRRLPTIFDAFWTFSTLCSFLISLLWNSDWHEPQYLVIVSNLILIWLGLIYGNVHRKEIQTASQLKYLLLFIFYFMEIYSFSFSYSDGDHCFLISFLRMSEVRNCHFGYPQKDETRVTLLPELWCIKMHRKNGVFRRFLVIKISRESGGAD